MAAAEDLLRVASGLGDAELRASARQRLAALAGDGVAAAEHLSRRAEDLLELGRKNQATACLETAVQVEPTRHDLRERLAALLEDGRPADALRQLEALLEAWSEQDEAPPGTTPGAEHLTRWRLAAAEAAAKANLPERARHHLGVHLAHHPSDLAACRRLAELLRSAEEWEELHALLVHLGEHLLTGSDAQEDSFATALDALMEAASIAEDRLDRRDLARAALEIVLDVDPGNVPALQALLPLIGGPEWREMRAEALGRLAENEVDEKKRARLLCARGEALLEISLVEAELAFQMALADDPASIPATEGLASIAWKRGDLFAFASLCWSRARQACQAGSEDAGIRLLVTARLHLDLLGDTRTGLSALELAGDPRIRASLTAEELAEVLRRRLACHLALGDSTGAVDDLTEMIDLASGAVPEVRAALHRRRAGLRESKGDVSGAREDWSEAHRLNRDDPIALERLIAFAESDGDLRALAQLHFVQASLALRRGRQENAARALAERARLLAGPLDNPAEAAADLERAAELEVDGALKTNLLASLRELLLALDRHEEAVEVAKREAALLPPEEAAGHLLEVGAAAGKTVRSGLALACAREAWRLAPDSQQVAASLLQHLFSAGAIDECVSPARLLAACDPVELARALDLGEREAEERLRLAALILLETDSEAAYPLLDRLCDSRPGDAYLCDVFVELCISRGETERAERALEKRLEAVPLRSRAHLARRLSEIAAARGEPAREAEWLREAFRLEDSPPSDHDSRRLLSALLAGGETGEYAQGARRLVETLAGEDSEKAAEELAVFASLLVDGKASEDALGLLDAFDELCGDSAQLLEVRLAAAAACGNDQAR
ncbi:MAG: hypothetical protein ACOCVR_04730, partial [Myxococcota bacterium]